MIPICPECSKFGEPQQLTLDGITLVCSECGWIYPKEIHEQDGMVLLEQDFTLTPKPNSKLFFKTVDIDNPKDGNFAYVKLLPLEPYYNGKKVKRYEVECHLKLKVFYE